ncbi:MAG: 4-(cytidine 5'-diphospho)-2-C-methyl-D-erythritol kinase [Proteobacteria bacterium]|nr:4-(cytidine 5'-diphospho)-2-C-methyl-D-erythritol kinase [Pseudomonadota bacterium]
MTLNDLPAPAKLNLFLHVVGRRPDGYHLLQSVFVLVDWADTLHLTRRADGHIARHDLTAALPADDLCLRAARALQAASGTAWGVDIAIDKQVPWGAGLGGGSSDAATVLLGLNRLWGLDWPRARLLELGLTLGADVPFFLFGRNALVQGVGEQLTALDVPPQWFAVVKPPAPLPTAQIFQSPLLVRDTKPVIVTGSLATHHALEHLMTEAGIAPRNDLQGAAQALCPDVAQVARWLQDRYGNSRMTGSGSAVFASLGTEGPLAPELPAAQLALASALPTGWVGRLCRSWSGHPLHGWAG